MPSFSESLEQIANGETSILAKTFGSSIDERWNKEACQSAEQMTIRRRKLPLDDVVWLVIGMALYRDMSVLEVAQSIGVARSGQRKVAKVASSSTSQARQRLGSAPMEQLFQTTASHWSQQAAQTEKRMDGLRVFALDGTTLLVPDTKENRKEFGGPSNQHGPTGYPKVRLMVMLATSSHLVVDAAYAPYQGKGTGERTLMCGMARRLPDESLLLFDRGLFHCAELWAHQSEGTNRHWLGAIKSNMKFEVVHTVDEGDELVRYQVPAKVRAEHPEMPELLELRLLTGTDGTGKPFRLLTTLLDAQAYPSSVVWEEYGKRWEVELGYREAKTYMLQRSDPLRSKLPDGVRQELWGILIGYNLIRSRMAKAAAKVEVEPRRLSFKHCVHHIRIFCAAMLWMHAPSKMGKLLDDLDDALGAMIIPSKKARKKRSYPREIKARKKTYPIKRQPAETKDESLNEEH